MKRKTVWVLAFIGTIVVTDFIRGVAGYAAKDLLDYREKLKADES